MGGWGGGWDPWGDSHSWEKRQKEAASHHSTAGKTSPLWGRADPRGTQRITHRVRNFSLILSASKVSNEVENDYSVAIKMGKLSHRTGQGFV